MNATILVIDDDAAMRRFIKAVLEREGYQVVEAVDGADGLEKKRSHTVGLIIVDIFMPEKDGLETIIELRTEFPECPILAMSGGGQMGEMSFLDYSRQFGAKELLRKPFKPATLIEAVAKLVTPGSTC